MMNKTFTGILIAVLAIGFMFVIIRPPEWMPVSDETAALKHYASIDDVKSALHIRQIYSPSSVPPPLTLPPSEIIAQARPFLAIVMKFKRPEKNDIGLVLVQSRGGQFTVENAIDLTTIKAQGPFMMRGIQAVLTTGECGNHEPCGMVAWEEGKYSFTAVMRATPYELTKVVGSMRP
jgi:hypothetical protein